MTEVAPFISNKPFARTCPVCLYATGRQGRLFAHADRAGARNQCFAKSNILWTLVKSVIGSLCFHTLQQSLCPGSDLEFLIDLTNMGSDGFYADEELNGNLLVQISFRQVAQDFFFPDSEV